jgi:beta-lactam-binding protein with PASTA domain
MENIKELRNNLETFRKKGVIDSSSYTVMLNNLKGLEVGLESVEKTSSVYKESSEKLLKEKILLAQEKDALSIQVAKLSREKLELESRLSVLQKTRPALSPTNLVSTFKSSLEEMDRGLKKAPSGTKYSVSSMNVTLKTNLALEGDELRFQMPKADDIISPENLSIIEFSVKALPQKPDLASYGEVPDLVGLSKEAAEGKLLEAGFKPGEILEKDSSAPEGTVIAQIPSGGSLAEPGAVVDLIISRISSLKVPNLLGLELESAKQVLDKFGLELGGVRGQPSDTKPGIILAQSLKPGSEAEVDAKIFLMVSTEMKKEESEGVLSDRLKRPQITPLKVSSDISAKVSTETPVRAPAETPSKISTETPARVSTEPSVVAPGPVPEPKAPVVEQPEVEKPEGPVAPKTEVKTVPRVTGIPFEKAAEILKKEGVNIGKVSEIVSRISPGTVVNQSPRAGSIANLQIPVDLVVAKSAPVREPEPQAPVVEKLEVKTPEVSEPPKTEVKKVPRVVGLPLEKATATLEGVGIKVGKVSEIYSRSSSGTVVNQSPGAGSIANPRIPVDLSVSKERPDLNPRVSSITRRISR